MQSLSIAATGMLAQQLNVEVISNNIANMNTTGYKRQRAEFQDLLYQDQRRVGTTSSAAGTIVPTGIQLGIGVNAAATYRISAQGAMTKTDNQLDLAIRGEGFFQIELPDGQLAYTRAGAFQIGPTGNIVNQDGFSVQPGIAIPAEAIAISINSQGQVFAKIDGQVAETNLGQLQLAISRTRPVWRTSGTTCCWKPMPRVHRPWAPRTAMGTELCNKDLLRIPTSIRSKKSPI